MELFTVITIAFVIIIVWLILDYKLGRSTHLKKLKKQELFVRHSDLTFYSYGDSLYNELFEKIKQAKEHIHILFYIIKNDDISKEFLELLKAKAKEGTEVRLLVDWVGSKAVSKKMIQDLRQSGVSFAFSHKPGLPFLFYSLNARNHRKISVIDGKIGFIGGFNIGKEYLGHDSKLGFWRDYHLKVEGEGVVDLQTQFLMDWKNATKQNLLSKETYFPHLEKGSIKMKIVPTYGAYLQYHFLDLIKEAQHDIIIGSPYFIPGEKLKLSLIEAAKRGVRIKILIPMKADHPLVKEAAFPYFKPLMQEGIQFYQYLSGFYHAKAIIIDDKLCDIGTANFDKRSLYLNHEINCFIYDKPFIQYITVQVQKDIANAKELTMEDLNNKSILYRGKVTVSTLLSHFL